MPALVEQVVLMVVVPRSSEEREHGTQETDPDPGRLSDRLDI